MNQMQSTVRPARLWSQPYNPRQILVTALLAAMGLLVVSSLSLGTAFVTFRSRDLRPFDLRLSADKQQSLAVHFGPVCRQLPGIPDGSCGDYVPDLYEFDISYATPHTHQQWVSALVPIR
jgi:hypothetical protein